VDSLGQTVHLSTHNVTFRVVSGPGVILGTANGDSHSFQSHTSPSQTAYHGLARAIVQVTSLAGLSSEEKRWMQLIDAPSFSSMLLSWTDEDDIIIEATAHGLEDSMAQLIIPTSTNAQRDSVLAVAEANGGKAVDFFQDPADVHQPSYDASDTVASE
jgi:hypothetical protein